MKKTENTVYYGFNPRAVHYLGRAQMALFSAENDQNGLQPVPAELDDARLQLAHFLCAETASLAKEEELTSIHANAFEAQKLAEVSGRSANIKTTALALGYELDVIAMLMLCKAGASEVAVPTTDAIGNVLWGLSRNTAEGRLPYARVAHHALVLATGIVRPIFPLAIDTAITTTVQA